MTKKTADAAETAAEAAPAYAEARVAEGKLDEDGLGYVGECPICAAHNYMPNAETIAAIEEGRAMMRGEIPSKLYNSLEEMLADLDADD